MARCNVSSIVRLYGISTDKKMSLVMEYVSNGNLENLISGGIITYTRTIIRNRIITQSFYSLK
jgi:serine/threonine protein kinase